MYPTYQVNPPMHPQHRSWSDDHVVEHYPSPPLPPPAPRAASFSSWAPPAPRWQKDPSAPPVPPLPPSLIPGFRSPSLAHSKGDLFFAEPSNRPALWSSSPSASVTGSPPHASPYSAGFQPLTAPESLTLEHRAPFDANSSSRGAPVVPPRPTIANVHASINRHQELERSASLYSPVLPLPSRDYPPSSPSVVPPRPSTAHGHMTPPSSSSARSHVTPATPPIPFTPPTAASLLHSDEHAPSPPMKDYPPTAAFIPHSDRAPSPPIKEYPPTAASLPHSGRAPSPPIKDYFPSTTSTPEAISAHSRTQSLDDLTRALNMSLTESKERLESLTQDCDSEDQELARALAESLAISGNHCVDEKYTPDGTLPSGYDSHGTEPSGSQGYKPTQAKFSLTEPKTLSDEQKSDAWSKWPPTSIDPGGRTLLSAQELADHEAESKRLQEQEDEEVTQKLLEEDRLRLAAEKEERERQDEELARREGEEERARKETKEAQERKDADIARRMAEATTPERPPVPTIAPQSTPMPKPGGEVQGLPQYDDVVAKAWEQRSHPGPAPVHSASHPNGLPHASRPRRATSAIAANAARPEFSKSSTVPAGMVAQANAVAQGNAVRQTYGSEKGGKHPELRNASPGGAANPPGVSRNHVRRENTVDPELLKGVSFGFRPPDLQLAPAQLSELPPCPTFPEVISLHRAPCPPFHVKAPSWRHLMRLLAQLETRIEPSVDAIARSKENLLRVVVQFAKLPYTANTWHTIVYLSLDHPVPQGPNYRRFINGDTIMLPYSYSILSGDDTPTYPTMSQLSQIYVIPLSASSPFPILPIALPNLALYLQSAMRDSRARKAQNDAPYGMWRLAKIIGACYPEEVLSPDKEDKEPGRGVGGFFKRVVGRGPKEQDSQRNEDVYDIITPFRVDQYPVA